MTLRELFDGAQQLGADVCLFESDVPGAIAELIAWAAERGLNVRDETHVVADDHPMEAWRGLWVSTVKAGRITVHRPKPAQPGQERAA